MAAFFSELWFLYNGYVFPLSKTPLAHTVTVHYYLVMTHNETVQYRMALEFKDPWLELFYEEDKRHRLIPSKIENSLFRKLEILDAA